MKRDIIHIDEDLCDGCGNCIPNCHEGALQIIDNKARLVSDLMCDGLGACIGHCPQGAITIEEREAEAYNETAVMKLMAAKGRNTVIAHLEHLIEHDEAELVKEGMNWLQGNRDVYNFDFDELSSVLNKKNIAHQASKIIAPVEEAPEACGCSGTAPTTINNESTFSFAQAPQTTQPSQLKQWPVQFHLINPAAGYFKGADVLLASDCSAYTIGNFHEKYLKGKTLIIACPKLDTGLDSYVQKLIQLIDQAKINTIHVLIMEVPCCGGLMRLIKQALAQATRKVPVKATVISIEGKVLSEDWI